MPLQISPTIDTDTLYRHLFVSFDTGYFSIDADEQTDERGAHIGDANASPPPSPTPKGAITSKIKHARLAQLVLCFIGKAACCRCNKF